MTTAPATASQAQQRPAAESESRPRHTAAAKLHPKEHGAYAMLIIPIVTALLAVGLTVVGTCVAVSSFSGFLAHEPLLVGWGHRGRRAQSAAPQATRQLLGLLFITLAGGLTAYVLGSPNVRWSLLGCLLLAASSFAVAIAGKHRTLAGQMWGVVGLTSPCVPIQLAVNDDLWLALSTWGAWLVGFSATTVAVRSVIAAQKRQPRRAHALLIVCLTTFVFGGLLREVTWPVVALPMLLLSWYLLIAPPPTKHIRRVGWTLVVGTLASAVLVISGALV